MNRIILAAAITFLTIGGAESRGSSSAQTGHLIQNNDGKSTFVFDANGNPAAHRTHHTKAAGLSHRSRVRVASIDATEPFQTPQSVPRAEPMGHMAGSGLIRSGKTGATARVGAAYAARFQAYIDDLESRGASVRFMGGIRKGRCSSSHMHPCGRALDVCQLSRGHVDGRCHLPDRNTIAAVASRHGLFEGGQWCNSDYGHAQVGVSAAACGDRGRRHYALRVSRR